MSNVRRKAQRRKLADGRSATWIDEEYLDGAGRVVVTMTKDARIDGRPVDDEILVKLLGRDC